MVIEKYKERNEKKIIKLSEVPGKNDGRIQAKQLSLADVVKVKVSVIKAALPPIVKSKLGQRSEKTKLDLPKKVDPNTLRDGQGAMAVIDYVGEDGRVRAK
uniref:Uncharacterized protein n=1 Tax=Glossina morsitans morsitans TaxID=37546 RepID=A0A1B0F9V3_GLOMM